METFSALLAHCAGNSPVPVNSPHKCQWRRALMFSLICARINDWVNNRKAGDLRRYRGHYDVIVMTILITYRGIGGRCGIIQFAPKNYKLHTFHFQFLKFVSLLLSDFTNAYSTEFIAVVTQTRILRDIISKPHLNTLLIHVNECWIITPITHLKKFVSWQTCWMYNWNSNIELTHVNICISR